MVRNFSRPAVIYLFPDLQQLHGSQRSLIRSDLPWIAGMANILVITNQY